MHIQEFTLSPTQHRYIRDWDSQYNFPHHSFGTMKVFSLLSFLAFSAVSAAPAHYQDTIKVTGFFHPVVLPGDDYTGGSSIFPGRVIGGFGTAFSRYANADDWATYVLERCAATTDCIGTSSYSNRENLVHPDARKPTDN